MFQCEALNKGANVSLLQLICTIKFLVVVVVVVVVANVSLLQLICMIKFVILLTILLLVCVFFSLVFSSSPGIRGSWWFHFMKKHSMWFLF